MSDYRLTDAQKAALTKAVATRRSDADVDRVVEQIATEVRAQGWSDALDEVEREVWRDDAALAAKGEAFGAGDALLIVERVRDLRTQDGER